MKLNYRMRSYISLFERSEIRFICTGTGGTGYCKFLSVSLLLLLHGTYRMVPVPYLLNGFAWYW
jgi:hypothetical protein